MLIEWLITDSVADIHLNDFVADDESLYGFVRLWVFTPPLGFIINNSKMNVEGNSDIAYWMEALANVGKSIKNSQDCCINLISYDMLNICVKCRNMVELSLNSISDHKTISFNKIAYSDAIQEIIEAISQFVNYIKKENPSLLKSNRLKNIQNVLIELKQ